VALIKKPNQKIDALYVKKIFHQNSPFNICERKKKLKKKKVLSKSAFAYSNLSFSLISAFLVFQSKKKMK